jgi:hypothetical protein
MKGNLETYKKLGKSNWSGVRSKAETMKYEETQAGPAISDGVAEI